MLLTTLLHLLLLHVSSVILGAGPDLSYLSRIWGPPHYIEHHAAVRERQRRYYQRKIVENQEQLVDEL
jgi:hypothetical protein